MKSLRIVFMGTPDFAVPTLQAIIGSRHKVVGVVSQPDRPRGRGRKLQPTPVKAAALQAEINPVLQPEKMKDADFIDRLAELSADVFVVVAFRILPKVVFEMPPLGTINLHPSLLPKFRGAAPLNWAIINGEQESGISTIFIRKEIDAGNIILQRSEPLYPDETTGDIHDRFSQKGAEMIVESLDRISEGTVQTTAQDTALATPAPKITKAMRNLNFNQPAQQVKNWINGLSPFPGAIALWRGQQLKFLRAQVVDDADHGKEFGTVVLAENGQLSIACKSGIIAVTEIQLQGRKSMSVKEFLPGNDIRVGERLTYAGGE